MKLVKFLEFKEEDLEPIKSFHLKDELNPKCWENFELDEEIREQLLQIAQDFYENIDLNVDVTDIAFCGSLCNYNWSEKYSDFDLHVIVDFNKIDDNYELVEKYCDYAKKIWNAQHEIKIQGYDVEIAVQDINDMKESIRLGRMGGVFSLLNNKWIKKPTKVDFEPDEKMIAEKAKSIMMVVDDIESESDEDKYSAFSDKISKIWKKIKNLRQSGLDSESGEYSVGNLVFKLLRRNGYIQTIMKLKRSMYDKQFESLSEDDILKVLYTIDNMSDNFSSMCSESYSVDISYEYSEDVDYIDVNFTWSTYEEGGSETLRILYKETPIIIEFEERSYGTYGDYSNVDTYKVNSIDELIDFLKNKFE